LLLKELGDRDTFVLPYIISIWGLLLELGGEVLLVKFAYVVVVVTLDESAGWRVFQRNQGLHLIKGGVLNHLLVAPKVVEQLHIQIGTVFF